MQIGVSDGVHDGQPTTLRVRVLDVNDNMPEFNDTSYAFSIAEV